LGKAAVGVDQRHTYDMGPLCEGAMDDGEKTSEWLSDHQEQEPRALRQRLAEYPEAIRAVLQASHALRRPVSDIGPHDV
jgi:hypothetical protein